MQPRVSPGPFLAVELVTVWAACVEVLAVLLQLWPIAAWLWALNVAGIGH